MLNRLFEKGKCGCFLPFSVQPGESVVPIIRKIPPLVLGNCNRIFFCHPCTSAREVSDTQPFSLPSSPGALVVYQDAIQAKSLARLSTLSILLSKRLRRAS